MTEIDRTKGVGIMEGATTATKAATLSQFVREKTPPTHLEYMHPPHITVKKSSLAITDWVDIRRASK